MGIDIWIYIYVLSRLHTWNVFISSTHGVHYRIIHKSIDGSVNIGNYDSHQRTMAKKS